MSDDTPTTAAARRTRATRELAWLHTEALGDVCSLAGVHYRALEAVEEGLATIAENGLIRYVDETRGRGNGHKSRNFRGGADAIYPDEESSRRARLRAVSSALARLPTTHKAVLEARFDAGRPRAATLGLEPEEVEVACLFRDVVSLARRERITTRTALRRVLMTEGPESVRADVARVVDEALAAYCRARWG